MILSHLLQPAATHRTPPLSCSMHTGNPYRLLKSRGHSSSVVWAFLLGCKGSGDPSVKIFKNTPCALHGVGIPRVPWLSSMKTRSRLQIGDRAQRWRPENVLLLPVPTHLHNHGGTACRCSTNNWLQTNPTNKQANKPTDRQAGRQADSPVSLGQLLLKEVLPGSRPLEAVKENGHPATPSRMHSRSPQQSWIVKF